MTLTIHIREGLADIRFLYGTDGDAGRVAYKNAVRAAIRAAYPHSTLRHDADPRTDARLTIHVYDDAIPVGEPACDVTDRYADAVRALCAQAWMDVLDQIDA
jgi:hypothetical protein